MAECKRCGREFTPSKAGHVYCQTSCRHKGERGNTTVPPTQAQLKRLHNPSRASDSLVDEADWHPAAGSGWVELDLCQSLETRRRWHANLVEDGTI